MMRLTRNVLAAWIITEEERRRRLGLTSGSDGSGGSGGGGTGNHILTESSNTLTSEVGDQLITET